MADFGAALNKLWPNGDEKVRGLRAGIIVSAQSVFARHGITSPLLIAHVMAQISHECGAGHDLIENMKYSAGRMMQVWPSRFPTMASAQPYAGNPRALADKVYNGRMGNRVGTDDGYNFRGRGASQTTGREGYERVAKATGLDVVNSPDLLIDPAHFLECGVSDFINCGCLPYAKADNLTMVTKRLNGGTVGLAQRQAWLAKWKAAFGNEQVVFASAPPASAAKETTKSVVVATTTATVVTGLHRGWGWSEWLVVAGIVVALGVAAYCLRRWWKGRQASPLATTAALPPATAAAPLPKANARRAPAAKRTHASKPAKARRRAA